MEWGVLLLGRPITMLVEKREHFDGNWIQYSTGTVADYVAESDTVPADPGDGQYGTERISAE